MLHKGVIYSGMLFGLTLPFSTKYSNIALIVFYFLSFILIVKSNKKESLLKDKNLYRSTFLFIIPIIVGYIYLGLEDSVLKMLGRRITFLLSPVIILMLPKFILTELRKKASFGLILGSFFISLYLIFTVLKRFFLEKGALVIDKDLFNYYHTNANFMSNIDIHPSYYGMYLLVALFCLEFQKQIRSQGIKNVIRTIFFLSLIFINSRILLFLLFLFFIWISIKKITTKLKSNKQRLFAGFLGIFVLVIGFFSIKNTYIYHKFSKELAWDLSTEVGTMYNSKNHGDSRLARWKTAIDVIKIKPLLGYGAGNETNTLKEEYLERGMELSAKVEYNSHNQYLTTLLEGGLFAFLLFIGFFICNLYFAINKSDILFFFFLISAMTICLVESYFNRNAGITFFSFFSTIFLLSNDDSKE